MKKQVRRFNVTAVIDGKEYTGAYSVSGGHIYVSSDYGSEQTHLGAIDAPVLARQLLSEIVGKWLRRPH